MAAPALVATAALLPWEGQKCELRDLLLVCQGSWEATVLTRAIPELRLVL